MKISKYRINFSRLSAYNQTLRLIAEGNLVELFNNSNRHYAANRCKITLQDIEEVTLIMWGLCKGTEK